MHLETLTASCHAQVPLHSWGDITAALITQYHAADTWVQVATIPTIAEVRALKHFASQTPVKEKKLAILGFADQFRAETANSLLKLLEEPSPYLTILLLSESGRLLPTVRSRVAEVTRHLQSEVGATHGEVTSFQRWQELLSSYTVEHEAERDAARQLLYLQPLNHSTVNQEEVLDAYQSH